MNLKLTSLVLIAALCLDCSTTTPPRTSSGPDWVESTLQRIPLEQKVSQLVFVWTLGRYYPKDSDRWQELERLTRERKLGGFIFSIGDVYEYAVQINKLQEQADIPLLIAGDFEYGVGMRVHGSTTFPRAMAIGATRNPLYAYEVGKVTALEGRALGVHQNYAPDIDVNVNPKNPVINTRAFGDDVKLVSEMGVEFVKGTQDGGMIATVKHFPGHGDTDIDTHLGLSTLNFGKDVLENRELPPYVQSFNAGALSVMVGHLAVPVYDSLPGIPATVSTNITTRLLRDEMKFKGLVVTDAMQMAGVAKKYSPGEAAVLAIKAGVDLVLMPVDPDLAIDAIMAAVKRGELTEDRINVSVRKLLNIKQRMGLDVNRYVDVAKVYEQVGTRPHQMLAMEIARKAVTVLGNTGGILPLPKADTTKILDVIISDTEDPSTGDGFHRLLQARRGRISSATIDPRSNQMEYDSLLSKAKASDIVLCQLHLYTRSGEMTGFVDPKLAGLMQNLLALKKPVIAVSFGNPYVVMDFPRVDAYVCTYSDAEVMEQAAAEVLFAETAPAGKLPITIPGVYNFGDGVTYPKTTLRVGAPEEVGFDRDELQKVDNVMKSSIQDSAFPGGVLLAARNGVIVYNKAFGGYEYGLYSKRVDVNTIYDLASVTKVIATTSAVMRLVDEGKLRLEDRVVQYLPRFGQNGKENITLYNLMVHNSGLPAWRRFYDFCPDSQCVVDSVFATGLIYKTGDSTLYSDLGLITTGKVIEKITGVGLDKYVDSVFFRPLGMRSTMYNPPQKLIDRIAPTEVDTYWRHTGVAVRGRVHDENAATLGGVSGHAGLFSTTSDLAIFMQMLLNGGTYGGKRYISQETIARFIERQSDKDSRAIGWDTKTSGRSFSGTLTSMKTFLHTGFTGTSVVADPEKNVIIVLLTNRVYPSRSFGRIARARPRIHDAVLRALKEGASEQRSVGGK